MITAASRSIIQCSNLLRVVVPNGLDVDHTTGLKIEIISTTLDFGALPARSSGHPIGKPSRGLSGFPYLGLPSWMRSFLEV
jgi:hypothetical protein